MAEAYIDDFVRAFYVKLTGQYRDPEKFRPGQIFICEVAYTSENREYWRPVAYDSVTQTSAPNFEIVSSASDLYKRSFPLHQPHLKSDEEFVVAKAKRRPVVLLAAPLATLATAAYRHHTVVVPRFSVVKLESGEPKYPAALMARIRKLEFPDVFFTPSDAGVFDRDGVLRIDLLQPVPRSTLDPTPYALSADAGELLFGQFQHRLFGKYEGSYANLRELLLNQ